MNTPIRSRDARIVRSRPTAAELVGQVAEQTQADLGPGSAVLAKRTNLVFLNEIKDINDSRSRLHRAPHKSAEQTQRVLEGAKACQRQKSWRRIVVAGLVART
jgi:hypothetical protein